MDLNENEASKPMFLRMAQQVIDQLSQMFDLLGTGKSAVDFNEEIGKRLYTDPNLDPNALEEAIEQQGEFSNMDFMILAYAYAVSVLRDGADQNHDNAWVGVCNAQYWMGCAVGLGYTKGAARQVFTQRSKAGAAERDKKFEPVRQYALSLVVGKEHTFKSRNNAATSLKLQVLDFAKENGIVMFDTQMVNNLNRWFAHLQFGPKE